MSEYDFLFEDEAGQGIYDWLEGAWVDGAMIYSGDEYAIHRTMGNIHTHSENGGDVRQAGIGDDRAEGRQPESEDT